MGMIVFLGDSITDAGRKNSLNQLGNGYVNIFSETLKASGQQWNIINSGNDGNTAVQVAASLHTDCIAFHPDYVSILVGVNDIAAIASAVVDDQEKLYMLEDSIRAYHEMLFDLSRETHAKIITLEPFIFPSGEWYADLVPWQQKMSKNIKKLALNYGASFVSLQEPLNEKIAESGYPAITTDGVHLTHAGHQILAELIQNEFEF